MGILRELAEAFQASPDGKARLECGCLVRPTRFVPCVYHRREFAAELLAACSEDVPECTENCCDPS